jgi:hypothetical protein
MNTAGIFSMNQDRPMIGDIVHGSKVVAIGIKEGERWAMTIDRSGTVCLWPEGTWGDFNARTKTEVAR